MKAEAIETIPNMYCNSGFHNFRLCRQFWKILCCAGTSSLQSSMLCKQFQVVEFLVMKVIPSFRIRMRVGLESTEIPSGPSVYILWNCVEFQYSKRVSVYIPWNFKRAFFPPSLSLSLSLSLSYLFVSPVLSAIFSRSSLFFSIVVAWFCLQFLFPFWPPEIDILWHYF